MLPAPPGVYTPEAGARRLDVMRAYSTAATQVDADYMPEAEGELDAEARHALSAQRAAQAEREGYDAFCPFHRFEACRLRNSPRISPNYNPRSVVHAWLDTTGC